MFKIAQRTLGGMVSQFGARMPASRSFLSSQQRFCSTPQGQSPGNVNTNSTGSKNTRGVGSYSYRGALAVSIVSFAVGVVWVYLNNTIKEKRQTAVTESSTVGKPQLGGPWELTLPDGSRMKSSDLRGKYQLLYFGFTFCPDICPQELEKQVQVMERVEKVHPNVLQPVFITVDPRRDGPAEVGEYIKEFSDKMIGLTGNEEEIKKVTKMFRVYYNTGIKTSEEDYLIDHSIIHYLMGPANQFKDFYGKNLTVQEMADKIIAVINEDKAAAAKRKN